MSELSINTTQNVRINFTAASVGHRILAFGVDLLIIIAYFVAIGLIFEFTGLGDKLSNAGKWTIMAVIAVVWLPAMFYSFFFESIFEGQSPGKKLLKIKVVKIDGYQASLGDYMIRWLFRIIDIVMSWGIIGFVAMIMNKNYQRLGDMAAGTAVISLRNNVTINSTILEEIEEAYVPTYPLVIKLSDNDVRIIKEHFTRAKVQQDLEMLRKLRDKIESVTGIKNQSGNSADFIKTVLKDYNFYTQNM